MIPATKLVAKCKQAVEEKWRYWNSTFGQVATQDLLNRKRAQRPAEFPASREKKLQQDIAEKRVVCDCCGIVKAALWDRPETGGYIASEDRSADSMFEDAKKASRPWGTIDTIPDRQGVCVYKKGHMGVYVGNGEVVQMKGFNYGVVQSKVRDTAWTHWFEHVSVIYDTIANHIPVPYKEPIRNIWRGFSGQDVCWVQYLLNMNGYNLEVDGIFGTKTNSAVRNFQQEKMLEIDGIVGPDTRRALKEILQ